MVEPHFRVLLLLLFAFPSHGSLAEEVRLSGISKGTSQVSRNGSFQNRITLPRFSTDFLRAEVVDMDGDHWLDLLVSSTGNEASGNPSFGTLTWIKNTDAATNFENYQRIAGESTPPHRFTHGDLDNDGDPDVLAAWRSENSIEWHENLDGYGNFSDPHDIVLTASPATSLVVADLDGDNNRDILAASEQGKEVLWVQNIQNATTFSSRRTITDKTDSPRDLVVGDVDGDGDMDLATASWFDRKVAWFENLNGDALTWEEHIVSTSDSPPVSVRLTDLDLDGDLDLLTGISSRQVLKWFENLDGSGLFGPEKEIGKIGDTPYDPEIADFDGDGDPDIAVASFFDENIYWFENEDGKAGAWTRRFVGSIGRGGFIDIGDLNNDGKVDIVSTARSHPQDSLVYFENGGGQFSVSAEDISRETLRSDEVLAMMNIYFRHHGREGEPEIELAGTGFQFSDLEENPLDPDAFGSGLREISLYKDQGDQWFGTQFDDLVASATPSEVGEDGILRFSFDANDPRLRAMPGETLLFFLVVHTQAVAGPDIPAGVSITHLSETEPQARIVGDGAQLEPEFILNLSVSAELEIPSPTPTPTVTPTPTITPTPSPTATPIPELSLFRLR